jgi:hypothetical protein
MHLSPAFLHFHVEHSVFGGFLLFFYEGELYHRHYIDIAWHKVQYTVGAACNVLDFTIAFVLSARRYQNIQWYIVRTYIQWIQ